MRLVLSHKIAIHFFFFLGLFALFGYVMTDMKFLLLFVALSFGGAACGAAIKIIDEIRKAQK